MKLLGLVTDHAMHGSTGPNGPAWRRMGPVAALAVLLIGLVGWGLTLPTPGDADPYHDAVVDAAAAVPREIDGWVARDIPVPASAVELLRPNLLVNRQYVSPDQRDAVAVLVVQCKDARDLIGHWPPNCYPSAGATSEGVRDETYDLAGTQVSGRAYSFFEVEGGREKRYVVHNVLVLPDGRLTPEMGDVQDAGGDARIRHFGAAQVQVITDAYLLPSRRRELVSKFLTAYAPLIEAIGSGTSR